MSNLKIFCVTDKEVKFLENTNYNIGWVGKETPPENYILSDTNDNIFSKEKKGWKISLEHCSSLPDYSIRPGEDALYYFHNPVY